MLLERDRRRARSTRGSRSPRRRRRRPRATAWRSRGPRARRSRAAATRSHAAARISTSARCGGGACAATRCAAASSSAWSTSASDAIADSATTRSGSPGSTEISAPPLRVSSPTHTGTWITGSASNASSAPVQLRADRRPPQLKDRLVVKGDRPPARAPGDRPPGAASSSSSGTPRACSYRNDSLEVFSSSRRTRYAIPATRSPTGQYVRTRRPRAAIAACSGSPSPRRTCSSRSRVGAAGEPVVGDRVRDRAQVVRGDRDADRAAARRAAGA